LECDNAKMKLCTSALITLEEMHNSRGMKREL